jgi:hypothetical protein
VKVVAKHDAPVRHCFFVKQLGAGMLVTGGWDKTVSLHPALVWVPHIAVTISRADTAGAGLLTLWWH